jgi:hypothetical protein
MGNGILDNMSRPGATAVAAFHLTVGADADAPDLSALAHATTVYLVGADTLGYAPGTPSDWDSPPTTAEQALDMLAARIETLAESTTDALEDLVEDLAELEGDHGDLRDEFDALTGFSTVAAGATIAIPDVRFVAITDDAAVAANATTMPAGTNGKEIRVVNLDAEPTTGDINLLSGEIGLFTYLSGSWRKVTPPASDEAVYVSMPAAAVISIPANAVAVLITSDGVSAANVVATPDAYNGRILIIRNADQEPLVGVVSVAASEQALFVRMAGAWHKVSSQTLTPVVGTTYLVADDTITVPANARVVHVADDTDTAGNVLALPESSDGWTIIIHNDDAEDIDDGEFVVIEPGETALVVRMGTVWRKLGVYLEGGSV